MQQKPKSPALEQAEKLISVAAPNLLGISKELNQRGISFAQLFLLEKLREEDCLSMTEISKIMGHSTAAATGLVDRLESLGYVHRLHATDDRRKVMVQITQKAIHTVRELIDSMATNIAIEVEQKKQAAAAQAAA